MLIVTLSVVSTLLIMILALVTEKGEEDYEESI